MYRIAKYLDMFVRCVMYEFNLKTLSNEGKGSILYFFEQIKRYTVFPVAFSSLITI